MRLPPSLFFAMANAMLHQPLAPAVRAPPGFQGLVSFHRQTAVGVTGSTTLTSNAPQFGSLFVSSAVTSAAFFLGLDLRTTKPLVSGLSSSPMNLPHLSDHSRRMSSAACLRSLKLCFAGLTLIENNRRLLVTVLDSETGTEPFQYTVTDVMSSLATEPAYPSSRSLIRSSSNTGSRMLWTNSCRASRSTGNGRTAAMARAAPGAGRRPPPNKAKAQAINKERLTLAPSRGIGPKRARLLRSVICRSHSVKASYRAILLSGRGTYRLPRQPLQAAGSLRAWQRTD